MQTVQPHPQPDLAAAALGIPQQWVHRIKGMVAAGNSLEFIVERGRYEGTWSARDVRRVCLLNGLRPPTRAGHPQPHPPGDPLPLCSRQLAVLHHMLQASTNAEIAEATSIKEATVKADVRTIIRKSGRRDRIGVVVAVLTGALVPQDEDDL